MTTRAIFGSLESIRIPIIIPTGLAIINNPKIILVDKSLNFYPLEMKVVPTVHATGIL